MFVRELTGGRDLLDALVRLARWQLHEPRKQRSLWTQSRKMSLALIRKEWEGFLEIVRPDLADHLAIVAIGVDGVHVAPDSRNVTARALEARSILPVIDSSALAVTSSWSAPTPKFFAVWKVLFNAWLRNEGPLRTSVIARRSTSSKPTVRAGLRRLQGRREIEPSQHHGVEFLAMPKATLDEIRALSESLRRPVHYQYLSEYRCDPENLLKRLLGSRPTGVYIGGIAAARHHDSAFRVNELRRVDVVVTDIAPPDWVRALDPALNVVSGSTVSTVLVAHRVDSVQPLGGGAETSQWADPVETLLDLYEMRLEAEAERFLQFFRPGAAPAKHGR